jgi:hypothetical protein
MLDCRGTTIEKGIARLRGSRLQRALRTESEPPQFLRSKRQKVTAIDFDKALTQQGKLPTLACLPRSLVGSKADLLPALLPAAILTRSSVSKAEKGKLRVFNVFDKRVQCRKRGPAS